MPASDPALASALRLSVMRLARRMRSQRADTSLTLSQLSTLSTLDRHGDLTPRDLAEHEKVQPPSMTRMLAALEAEGLVTRAAHLTDGRQVLISLTKPARALLVEDRRRREAWLAQRLAALDPAERATLRDAAEILDRLAGA